MELVRVDPGQLIFRQGDRADHYYLVRLGFVKVTQEFAGQERVLDYLGPPASFGEIGLLSNIPEIAREHFPSELRRGVRTATCRALDHVELVRIRGEHFQTLVEKSSVLRNELVNYAKGLIAATSRRVRSLTVRWGSFSIKVSSTRSGFWCSIWKLALGATNARRPARTRMAASPG